MVDVPQKKKIEAMFSDNIKLKLKIKQMYDQIKEEQAENNKQMERIRIFIKNSNMNDDLKKNLMSKIEGVLSNGLADKLNLKEIEKIAKIDQSDIQDKFLSNVIGDTVKLLKNIKNEEKKKIQQQQQPDYNQDFDPQLLEDNQQIVVQTVKKKIKQKDASGNIVEDEIDVIEEIVIDKTTGKEVRKREKQQTGFQVDAVTKAFTQKFGGLAIGGAKFVKPQKFLQKIQ